MWDLLAQAKRPSSALVARCVWPGGAQRSSFRNSLIWPSVVNLAKVAAVDFYLASILQPVWREI